MKKKILGLVCCVIFCLGLISGCALSADVNEEQIYRVAVEVERVGESGMWVRANGNELFERAYLESTDKTVWRSARGERISIAEFEEGDQAEVLILPPVQKDGNTYATILEADKKEGQRALGEYERITPQEAKAMMNREEVVILDVRTEEEYEQEHIQGSILLPYDQIEMRAEAVLTDKDAKILVYCRSGQRSRTAARSLLKMGYNDVYDFGGILDWPYETVR